MLARNTKHGKRRDVIFLKNKKERLNIISIIIFPFVIVFIAFNNLHLSMGRFWNAQRP